MHMDSSFLGLSDSPIGDLHNVHIIIGNTNMIDARL